MVQLDHINMTVRDLRESIQWYNKVFNFKPVETGTSSTGAPYAIIKNGESMLCIYESPDLKVPSESDGVHRTYHFGLRITDATQWESIMKKEQVNLHHTWEYPHSFSWYIFDPSGHEIEVVLWNNNQIQF